MNKEVLTEKVKNIIGKMRPMDYMILGVIIFVLIILLFIGIGKKVYAPTPVESEGKVSYEIFFKGVVVSAGKNENPQSPFEVGAQTFVTIRNVPHAKLKITGVQYNRRMKMLPLANGKEPYVLVDDKENPLTYDFLVTVEDTGKFTSDGVVSGGNKIKVGLPITLEGDLYRLNGVISNVTVENVISKENE